MRLVDANGRVAKATRFASSQASVRDSDIADPSRLGDIIRALSARVSELEAKSAPEGTEFEVEASEGSQVRLYHGFRCPVRYYLVRWKDSVPSESNYVEGHTYSMITRAAASTGLLNAAGNIVSGVRIRTTTTREIVGVRFFWATNLNVTYTVRVRVWNDSTGLSLAQKDVQVMRSGVYEAIFDTPITANLTGTDITMSVRELSGVRFTYNNNDVSHWGGLAGIGVGLVINDLYRVHTVNLTGAGDIRPTSTASSHSFPIEPIFRRTRRPVPTLEVSEESTDSELVLNCHATGKAVIRVEPSQSGLVHE